MKLAVVKFSIPFNIEITLDDNKSLFKTLFNFGQDNYKPGEKVWFSKYDNKLIRERGFYHDNLFKSQFDNALLENKSEYFTYKEFTIKGFLYSGNMLKMTLFAALISEPITILDSINDSYICMRCDKSEELKKGKDFISDVFYLKTYFEIEEYKAI